MKRKAKDLKTLLTPGMEMTDEELQHLVSEIEDYRKKMEKAEVQMKSSLSAFMTTHLATMEVLGVTGEVKYSERFSREGPGDLRCMFCTMVFDSHKMKKRYILSFHWNVFEVTLGISHKCFKFLYENAIASAYSCASIFGFSTYENILVCGRYYIVLFAYCRGMNKQLKGEMQLLNKKIRITSQQQISEKEKQM